MNKHIYEAMNEALVKVAKTRWKSAVESGQIALEDIRSHLQARQYGKERDEFGKAWDSFVSSPSPKRDKALQMLFSFNNDNIGHRHPGMVLDPNRSKQLIPTNAATKAVRKKTYAEASDAARAVNSKNLETERRNYEQERRRRLAAEAQAVESNKVLHTMIGDTLRAEDAASEATKAMHEARNATTSEMGKHKYYALGGAGGGLAVGTGATLALRNKKEPTVETPGAVQPPGVI